MPAFPPDGTSLFLDANILYYHFVRISGLSEWSSDILERVANKRLTVFTSIGAMADVIHKIMTTEAAFRFKVNRSAAVNYLRHNPERVRELMASSNDAAELGKLDVNILTPDRATLVDAAEVSRTFGLLTNDALIVALMRRAGLSHLATNDDDFDRVTQLTLWKPR